MDGGQPAAPQRARQSELRVVARLDSTAGRANCHHKTGGFPDWLLERVRDEIARELAGCGGGVRHDKLEFGFQRGVPSAGEFEQPVAMRQLEARWQKRPDRDCGGLRRLKGGRRRDRPRLVPRKNHHKEGSDAQSREDQPVKAKGRRDWIRDRRRAAEGGHDAALQIGRVGLGLEGCLAAQTLGQCDQPLVVSTTAWTSAEVGGCPPAGSFVGVELEREEPLMQPAGDHSDVKLKRGVWPGPCAPDGGAPSNRPGWFPSRGPPRRR